MSTRLAFAGAGRFACPALRALARHADFAVALVVAGLDRKAGRGMPVVRNPVALAADELGLKCAQPDSDELLEQLLGNSAPDFAVVCAYGRKFTPAALAAPKCGCVNIHASLLPRWRGAAPIERAIMAGDAETGITTMLMAPKIDAGQILQQRSAPIGDGDTGGALRAKLANLGAELIVTTLQRFAQLTPRTQQRELASYARKIDKRETRLDFSGDAQALQRKVRALCPAPGAYATLGGQRVKILAAQVSSQSGQPGEVVAAANGKLIIACAAGALSILQLQSPGRQTQPIDAWLRGSRQRIRAGMLVGN